MRVLRSTCYADPYGPPVMAIAFEEDMPGTIEELQPETEVPGVLVLHDVFEVPEGTDLPAATIIAGQRITDAVRQREKHQALLYHYLAMAFAQSRDGASIAGDKYVPLTTDQMLAVFRQLAKHPGYRGFRFLYPDRDGQLVEFPQ